MLYWKKKLKSLVKMVNNHSLNQNSSNFHLALFVLPKAKRKAMFDFYRFCRTADDIVDELGPKSTQEAQKALQELRNVVELSFSGSSHTPLGETLRTLVKAYPVQKENFLQIIEGCEMDLVKNRYQTFSELYQYCLRVASAVGLVSIAIFGCSEEKTRDYAINLGVAFQITNILRDLREDKERGRIYLPLEDLTRFGYSEDMLINEVSNSPFQGLMEFECQRAEKFYHLAEKNLCKEDQKRLIPAQIMRAVYHHILNKINKKPEVVLKKRIQVSKSQKILLALSAVAKNF